MTLKSWEQKAAHIQKVVAYARDHLDKEAADELTPFIELFCETLSPDETLECAIEDIYGAALAAWEFTAERAPGEAKVRVYNPTLEAHGWESSHTTIEIVNDDMPFLVDSVTAELTRLGREIHLVNHPVMSVIRNAKGRRTAFLGSGRVVKDGPAPPEGAIAESFMHIEIDEQTAPEVLAEIKERIESVLADVRAAVTDWKPMLRELERTMEILSERPPPISTEDLGEVLAFLHWLGDDHFTFLGFREYRYCGEEGRDLLEVVEGSGLGILGDPDFHVLKGQEGLAAISAEVRDFLRLPDPIIITKANVRSTIHRPVHLDYIGVKVFDDDGNLAGERRFVGLFTSVAYSGSASEIPLLRRKVERTLERAGFLPSSHDRKALLNILETYPRDELFQIDDDDLFHTSLGILRLQERPRPKAFLRYDRFERFVSVLVFVPREVHDTRLRTRIAGLLAELFHGSVSAQYTLIGDEVLARLHFIIRTTPGQVPDVDPDEVDRLIAEAARTWQQDLRQALIEHWGEEKGNRLWHDYGEAFSLAYREAFRPQLALVDIDKLEEVIASNRVSFNIYRLPGDGADRLRLKIYHPSALMPLSDCLPKLEHLGLKVLEEQAYSAQKRDAQQSAWMHDFLMIDASGAGLEIETLKPRLEETLTHIWNDEVEDDGFNSLVLRVGLDWREAMVLRAYAKYLWQTGTTFSQSYMEATLAGNPAITRLLVDLFLTLFDPDRAAGEKADEHQTPEQIIAAIRHELEAVASLDQDRILRQFLNLITATLRTNYFQTGDDGGPKPYLSLKLDSQAIKDLPLPKPFVEIFVYSPRVEGVHLRGGKVARGGLRWSDRREDYRTEILGLMKAQMVKNVVIVPVGAKGGFVPKRLPSDGGREAMMEEGIACYRLFISGLLDLTDNLVGGEVVVPDRVIRRDGDDPYLVVAADKGTATFSDIANEISARYGFWLGDGFASGGSAGYDHKKMGITARGAWVSVRRHFLEIGVDVQTTPFTVIGIGDMSGDVFGNGMLQSPAIRLLGAFDHRHVFIDPDPDPETSFAERKRLFEMARSSWADYDESLISEGGGVFDRRAKSIPLSPQMKALLECDEEALAPAEVIRALLKAKADLLWVGGIGTYVKARDETNAEVGDRANDALRVNGHELRVRVVGEGGNLGFTQRGRIEYARAGGRINTDAVDNSAGVDCSDHEVNIKILLNAAVAEGRLTMEARNALLEEMTDEVAELVLEDNHRQTQAISITCAQGENLLESQGRLMRRLERAGRLDRDIEHLPEDEDLAELAARHKGLTRPEIAVLLAYAKMALYDTLLDSDVPDEPFLERELVESFPPRLHEQFAEAMARHRLRREIIATRLANDVLNWGGPSFVDRIEEDTGMAPPDIVKAFVVTREAFDLARLWRQVDGLGTDVPSAVQTSLILAIITLSYNQTLWFLTNVPQPLDMRATIEAYAPGIEALRRGPESLLSDFEAKALRHKRAEYVESGVPEDLAHEIASLEPLEAATDICFAANKTGRSVEDVAEAYYELGSYLGLNWLRTAAEDIEADDYWVERAVAYLIDDLYGQQRALTMRVLTLHAQDNVKDALADWAERNAATIKRSQNMISEIRSSGMMTVAKLAYANRHVRGLLRNGLGT